MSDPAEMAERHARVLAELSELGLALARDLQARALGAETPDEAAELSLGFHRISRSVRQTLALEARLVRDARRQEREDRAEAQRAGLARVQQRKAQVRLALERLIWTEAEGVEAERLLDELDDRLDEEALADGFAFDPVEAQIERLRQDLELTAEARGLSPLASPTAAHWTAEALAREPSNVAPADPGLARAFRTNSS